MTQILNETQIDNILSSQCVGRIGFTDGIRPYIVPVSYVYDGKNIMGQTREGMKLDIIRKNPNVCFEVDIINNAGSGESVLITGTFRELKGKISENKRKYLFDRVWPLSTSAAVHAHEHEVLWKVDDDERIKPTMYLIKILEKSGRRITQ